MSTVGFLRSFFSKNPIRILSAFLFLIISPHCHAVFYTVTTAATEFTPAPPTPNTLNVGDTLIITGTGDLTQSLRNPVILNTVDPPPGPTTLIIQAGGQIRSTGAFTAIGTLEGAVGDSLGDLNITNQNTGLIFGPQKPNGYGIYLATGNATSNPTIVNGGTINGIVIFEDTTAPGVANGSYTQGPSGVHAYALPGTNTFPLLDGNGSTSGTLTINGGTIAGRIANFATVNLGGSFATSSGTGSDPTGITNCTTINVNIGTFTINHAISTNTFFTVANGATALFNTGGTLTQGAGGTVTLFGTGIFNLNSQSQTVGNLVSASTTSTIPLGSATLTTVANADTTFAGVISGTGGLTKNGVTILTLSGNNTYTGTTRVNVGTLRMGIANALAPTSTFNLVTGAAATFDLNDFSQTIGDFSSGTGTFITLGTATLTVGTANSTTSSGTISETGSLTKQGSGTLTLPVANTYSGGTTLTAGTLLIGNATSLGSGTLTFNGGTLAASTTLAIANPYTFTASSFIGGTNSLKFDGAGSLGTNTLTINNTATTTISTLTGTGSIVLNAGILNIPAGAAFGGSVAINTATLMMSGGTVAGTITGNSTSTLSVTGAFSTAAAITNVGTINVAAPGTFTINNPVTGTATLSGAGTVNLNTSFTTPASTTIGQLTINAPGTLVLTSDVTGNVTNNGAILHSEETLRTITGNFGQFGEIGISITDINNYSQIQVNGTTTMNGGTIEISLPNGPGNILDQDVFDVITSGALNVISLSQPTFASPPSQLLSFTSEAFGNIFRLRAHRVPLQNVETNPVFENLTEVLDDLRQQGTVDGLRGIIDALDAQLDEAGLNNVLEQISPFGINESLFDTTSQNLPFSFLEHRLILTRAGCGLQAAVDGFNRKTGYAAGDLLDGSSSYGPMVFGNSVKQQTRNGIVGYTAFSGGFGFLGDTPISEYFRVGGALSYTGSSVKQSNSTGNVTIIGNVQGTVYASANYGPLFLDGLASLGFNNYRGKRNILVIGETATSNYQAVQYSGKLKGGFIIPFYTIEASPLATLHYTHLNQGRYTEKGAPGANLSVNAVQVNAVQIGLGGSIAEVSQAEDFLPEIHALYLYYTKPPNLQITSQFVDTGPSFVIVGVLPPKASFNVGGSITMMMTDELLLSSNYDLELKKGFVGHSVSFKFKWLF